MAESSVKMIEIETPVGTFNVWTKRIGNNPRIKVLLLHGGPGGTHEVFKTFENYLPNENIEFYYYNQLGSYLSDKPKDTSLWTMERFVDEVEQVRKALDLTPDNFYLLGYSWGGMLAIDYALTYQKNLKGLILSNMMSNSPDYAKYLQKILAEAFTSQELQEIREMEANNDRKDIKYTGMLVSNFYFKHHCRLKSWPRTVTDAFSHLNDEVTNIMSGASVFGLSNELGKWNRKDDLPKLEIPTLVIGCTFDTMDPEHLKWMATQVKQGSAFICPNGGHMPMWDDKDHYFPALIQFIKSVDKGEKPAPVIQI